MESLEERLRFLEASVDTQEQILTGLQAERIEAERLHDSIERLGLNAEALRNALLAVDKNQQMLTKLGQQLQDVDEKSVSKEELEARDKERAFKEAMARRARRRRRLGYAAITAIVVGVLGTMFLTRQHEREQDQREYRQSSYNICVARSDQNAKVRKLIENGRQPTTPQERAQMELILAAFPVVDCSELDPDAKR